MTPSGIVALHDYIQITIEHSNSILEIVEKVILHAMPRSQKEYQQQIGLMLDTIGYSDTIPWNFHFDYSDEDDDQYDISRILRCQENIFKRCTCIGVLFSDIIKMITFSDSGKATEYVYFSALASLHDSLYDDVSQLQQLAEKAEQLWQGTGIFQPSAGNLD